MPLRPYSILRGKELTSLGILLKVPKSQTREGKGHTLVSVSTGPSRSPQDCVPHPTSRCCGDLHECRVLHCRGGGASLALDRKHFTTGAVHKPYQHLSLRPSLTQRIF